MSVRFKVDEDLPGEIAPLLRAGGFDAVSILEEGLGGAPDSQVWEVAQAERRCLLTADTGSANARTIQREEHDGIILLRLPRESRAGYIQLVEGLPSKLDMNSVPGSLVSVSPDAMRIHRAKQ